jgi:hypothetical protein
LRKPAGSFGSYFHTEIAIHPPEEVAKRFLECFDGSAIELFRRFIARHSEVRKWIIAADFSQHNDRPFDCFAFTIIPCDAWPAEIERDVKQALPKDLKKSKDLNDEAIEWLRDPRRFHVAITVNDRPAVFWNGPGSVPLAIAREFIAITLANAVQASMPEETLARIKKLKQDAQANGFNVGLLANIWLLAVWFAILTILIGRERRSEIISWFPDRDNMSNYCDHIWYDLALWNAQLFAQTFSVDMTTTRCPAGAPDRSGVKERMWFDYMIRAADWIAGTVAAWDRKRNLVPGDQRKYLRMLENVIPSADNIVVLHLDMNESGMQFRRIVAKRKNWFMRIINDFMNAMRRIGHWIGTWFGK